MNVEPAVPGRKLRLGQLPERPGEPQVKPSLATDEDDSGSESDPNPAGGKGNGRNPAQVPKHFDRYIAPEMSSCARVFRFSHMLLVPTKINNAPGKLFLIDSGAWNNMITPDAAREVTEVHGDSDTIIKGLSGSVKKVYETSTVVLEFGSLRQENEDMVSVRSFEHQSRCWNRSLRNAWIRDAQPAETQTRLPGCIGQV